MQVFLCALIFYGIMGGSNSQHSQQPCLPNDLECHGDGSLGNCCSGHCDQLPGKLGICKIKNSPNQQCLHEGEKCGVSGDCCSTYCDTSSSPQVQGHRNTNVGVCKPNVSNTPAGKSGGNNIHGWMTMTLFHIFTFLFMS